ncbi:S-adenosylmethionine-dependent methyltransferase Rv2258c-like [Crassostrea virginica]
MASDHDEPRDLEQIVRDGISTLVFGFGYRAGILDSFIKTQQPCSAEELAKQAGMKVRYIEEWLSCLAAAGIVRVHDDDRFSLPYDEAKLRLQGHIAGVIPVLCDSIPDLEDVIKTDGPRGYSYKAPFLKFVEGFSSPATIENWVKKSLEPVLQLKPGNQFTLLDLGCGYGRHACRVGQLYPESSVIGVDMDQISIDRAMEEQQTVGVKNVQFICTVGGHLPSDWTDKFDFVVINQVMHDAPGVDDIMKEVKRVLNPDGFAAAWDPPVSSYPKEQANNKQAQQFLPFSVFSCLPMSLSDPSGKGEGLGVGWGYQRKKEKIEEHGFRVIQCGDVDVNTVQDRIVFKK